VTTLELVLLVAAVVWVIAAIPVAIVFGRMGRLNARGDEFARVELERRKTS
jgi:hypothetical protein